MLKEKQKRFCDEYLIDFNATQAAMRAGYSAKTSYAQGERLLRYPQVQEYLAKGKAALAEKNQITKEQLLQELAKIAFFDIRKIFTVDGGLKLVTDFEDDEAGAIAGIETFDVIEPDSGMILGTTKKVKISSKIAAIERISRMLGYDAPAKVAATDKDGNNVPLPPPQIIIGVKPKDFPSKEDDIDAG